jgi:hypothetical protein
MPITLIYEGIPQVGLFLIHCAECEHQSSLVLSLYPLGRTYLTELVGEPETLLVDSTLLGSDPLDKPIIVSSVCL